MQNQVFTSRRQVGFQDLHYFATGIDLNLLVSNASKQVFFVELFYSNLAYVVGAGIGNRIKTPGI